MNRSIHLLTAALLLGPAACADSTPTALSDASLGGSSAAAKPVPHWPDVITLPTNPEGIAIGDGHRFWVGNLSGNVLPASGGLGAIYAGDLRTGAVSLLRANDGKQVLGLKYDGRTGYLFLARGGSGWGSVIEAATGATVAEMQFAVGSATNPTFVNDVVVTGGAAYFTDSRRAVLYRVPLNADGSLVGGFDLLPLTGEFVQGGAMPCLITIGANPALRPGPLFANGIEATEDGAWLLVNSLANGVLYRVDPATGDARLVDLGGDDVCLADGNLLHGRTLYVMQNLHGRMAVVELADDLLSGTVVRQIQGSVPMTTMARFGNSIYAVTAGFGFLLPPTAPAGHPFRVERFDMR